MRFLLDESISPLVAGSSAAAGYEVVHARDIGRRSARDSTVLAAALDEGHVLVTLDTDFAALSAQSGAQLPSVVLFRGDVTTRPAAQAALLLANLEQFAVDLDQGAVVVIGDDRVRIRRLAVLNVPEPGRGSGTTARSKRSMSTL